MNASERPLILFDPFPRSIAQIFDAPTKARLDSLGNVIWFDGEPASDAHLERYLPEAVALVRQSALPKERLDRAPKLKAVGLSPQRGQRASWETVSKIRSMPSMQKE